MFYFIINKSQIFKNLNPIFSKLLQNFINLKHLVFSLFL